LQEENTEQTRKPGATGAIPELKPSPTKAVLSSEQYLAAGPRNPVGIVWINLAKANSTEPLPYGLHGTSIPDQMNVEQSIGGFRLANWDIARAVHHLPAGTQLEWK
jgi:lipoprotein-anchoring transpeptidase ErfK/SrfK